MQRMRTILGAAATGCLALLFQTADLSAAGPAGVYVILGPIQYQRTNGGPTKLIRTFSAPKRGSDYIVHVFNGGDHAQFRRASSATISINGRQIFKPSDFNQGVSSLERRLDLISFNDISIEIQSAPGAGFTIVITGKDDDDDNPPTTPDGTPPLIQGAVTPTPNAKGWNNTNVNVSFTCSDASSGIASCSGPVVVSTEGAQQAVTGTAIDKGDNTATTTVNVSLDKTAPTILAAQQPQPNSGGWNNTNVTVTFTCNDSLSGVAICTPPLTMTTDGANQVVSGTVTDNAGNTATSSTAINIDKTPPTITAGLTPAPNGAGWINTNATVDFTCADTLSGIASCPASATLTTNGALQTVTGAATDHAGNSATTTITANIDKTAPALSVGTIPATVFNPNLDIHGVVSDALSGVLSVTCRGINASISGTDFTCSVSLTDGANTIDVVASDQAGNTTTSSVNVTMVTFVPPPFGPVSVSWINMVGATANGNRLSKTSASGLWDAGAVSLQVLRDGYGFVEFTALETNTARMAGLGTVDTNQDYTDVDYGVLLRNDGSLAIYESGVYRGEFGFYAASDRLRVEVRYGVVRYLRNGTLFYTSGVPVRYPLRVDTSLFTPGATLTDVRIGNFVWTDGTGVSISGESLLKTGAAGWNAAAISTNTIESQDGYFEFTATETDTLRIAGLANLMSGVGVADIQFGIQLNASDTIEVVESGTSRGSFGGYVSGDRLRIELINGVVRYYRNGVQLYTSLQTPSYPLRADCSLNTPSATITNATLEPIAWGNTNETFTDGATLIKMSPNGWTGAASSTTTLQSGDGYVEFTAIETNSRRAAGLKSAGSAQSLQQMDFAISLSETGIIEVVETGFVRGQFGNYQSGDRFRVEVQNGIVCYRKNGVVIYTSAVAPSYPLHAETVFYTQGATLFDVAMNDLVFVHDVNVTIAGRTLLKTSIATAWNAGAVSTKALNSGFMEFTASEATTYRIAGLSNGDSNQDYTDIDFAILLRSDNTVAVYEGGVYRGDFSTYVAGDRFRVEVQSGVVRYRKNGTLFYTSGVAPTLPLRIDTSINGPLGVLFNVVYH